MQLLQPDLQSIPPPSPSLSLPIKENPYAKWVIVPEFVQLAHLQFQMQKHNETLSTLKLCNQHTCNFKCRNIMKHFLQTLVTDNVPLHLLSLKGVTSVPSSNDHDHRSMSHSNESRRNQAVQQLWQLICCRYICLLQLKHTNLTLGILYHTMPHTPCRFEVNDVHSLMSYTTPCHTRHVGLR